MIEQGVVIKNKGKYSEVRIERNSACGSCGKCGMTEKQKHADFFVENACNAVVGDIVELDIPEGNPAKLAFVAYIIPLIPSLILLCLSVVFKWKEWLTITLFFVGLAVGFAMIALIDKLHKRKWTTSPTMKSVIKLNQNEDNILKGENENE